MILHISVMSLILRIKNERLNFILALLLVLTCYILVLTMLMDTMLVSFSIPQSRNSGRFVKIWNHEEEHAHNQHI